MLKTNNKVITKGKFRKLLNMTKNALTFEIWRDNFTEEMQINEFNLANKQWVANYNSSEIQFYTYPFLSTEK